MFDLEEDVVPLSGTDVISKGLIVQAISVCPRCDGPRRYQLASSEGGRLR